MPRLPHIGASAFCGHSILHVTGSRAHDERGSFFAHGVKNADIRTRIIDRAGLTKKTYFMELDLDGPLDAAELPVVAFFEET